MNLSSQLICRHCQKPKSEHHQFYACQDLRLKRNCELDTFFEPLPLPSDQPSPTPSPICRQCGKPYSVHTNYVCLPDGTTHGAAPLPQPTDTMNTPKKTTSPPPIDTKLIKVWAAGVDAAFIELANRLEQKTDNAIVEIRHMVSLLSRDGADMDKRVRNMQTEINMLHGGVSGNKASEPKPYSPKEAPVDLSEIKQLLIKLSKVLEAQQSNPSSSDNNK